MTTPPPPFGESRWLAVDGAVLRDANGAEVRLRGVGVGGWLNMENFITGYPGTESLHRSTMRAALGPERADRLFARFLTAFFGDDDTAFLASLGLNAVRIPVNYHHLQEDLEPDRIRAGAFDRLDRAVAAGTEVGLWTVIDLHALPESAALEVDIDSNLYGGSINLDGYLTAGVTRISQESALGRVVALLQEAEHR